MSTSGLVTVSTGHVRTPSDLEFCLIHFENLVSWYRLTQVNFKDEIPLLSHPTIDVPCLFIQALKDKALPPGMGISMATWVPQLTVEHVNTNHWALWEDPKGVNDILGWWLGRFFTLDEEGSKL
jgi:pimeloyl-ACP methyl ester carboxylesterase